MQEKFHALFAGLPRAYGLYKLSGEKRKKDGKQEGKAETVRGTVTPALWRNHLEGKVGLGIVPIRDDNTCRWGAIDIDAYDNFDLKKLEAQVQTLKLPLKVCRTKSGGAHLYLFFKEDIEASVVRDKLMEWTVALGRAGVEIFPKQVSLTSEKDTGNWINMPYFEGDESTRYCIFKGKSLTAEAFVDQAWKDRIDLETLLDISPPIPPDVEQYFPRVDAPPCLQSLAASGGIPEGSRNNGLFDIGVYLRKKHGDEEWEEYLDEYNHKFLDPPLGSSEVETLKKTLKKKTYQYRCTLDPIVGVCNKEICLTRNCGVGWAEDSGVDFGDMMKINTVPPIWIWKINGHAIECTTDELLNQKAFEKRVAEDLTILIYTVSAKKWKETVRLKLEKAEEIAPPPDATPGGEISSMLDRYLTEMNPAATRDELLMDRPWTENGRTHFSGSDFHAWLKLQRMNIGIRNLWALMRVAGADNAGIRIKGRFKNYWSIPELEVQDGEFEPPEMEDKSDF